MITFDAFQDVVLQVGTVRSADPIEGSHKLLRLLVDIGSEERQILAGIASAYTPEDLVRTQVVVVTNLVPRTMMGLESQGMIVAATVDGQPVLIRPEKSVEPGTRLS